MLLLRPRDLGPEPVAGGGASLLQRGAAREGRGTSAPASCGCYGAQTAIELGVLVAARRGARRGALLATPPPGAGRRRGRRGDLGRRSAVATLPVRAVARERAKDVGLVTQALGAAGPATSPSAQAIGAVLAGAGGALLVVGDAPLRPPLVGRRRAAVVVGFGVVITYARPGRARPAVQQVHAAAGRRDARRRARLAREARRRRRPGLRDRRLAPHDGRQRLRDRASATPSASCSTTPAEGLHARPRRGSWSPTSSATCATATCRTGCSTSRSSRRSGCSPSPALGERLAPRDALGTAPPCPRWRSRSR